MRKSLICAQVTVKVDLGLMKLFQVRAILGVNPFKLDIEKAE